jgi:quercetin dioxygenase-like cupin family protein
MKACKVLSSILLVLLWSGAAFAQDPVKVDPQHYKVVFENASVRVLKIDYAPGSKSVMHQHPDSIAIPLADSKVRFHMADGKSEDSSMASESAMYTPAGTHNPENIGTGHVDVVLVEFKAAKPGTAALPPTRDNLTMKVLAEGARAVAYRVTASPNFQEPAGSKHDYDQVVISLAPSQMSLSINGKPAKTSWARGDAQFIGRGTPHESKNTGGKPTDFVIVAVK